VGAWPLKEGKVQKHTQKKEAKKKKKNKNKKTHCKLENVTDSTRHKSQLFLPEIWN